MPADNPGMGSASVADAIEEARNPDGGFGPVAGADSEPETTAMVALATGDERARTWVEAAQRPDGSVGDRAGDVFRDLTSLAALVLPAGAAREHALDHLEAARATKTGEDPNVPHDPSARGWPWTTGTFGWVEPTSWAVLALRSLRPGSGVIADGLALLADRECDGGGWNYGNAEAFGQSLVPFGQTTAMALLALHDAAPGLEQRGLAALRRLAEEERDGTLTLALATVAFRVYGQAQAERTARWLRDALALPDPLDTATLAWAALALGSDPGKALLGR